MSNFKKVFLIFFFSFLLLIFNAPAFVQALEIQYPTINGLNPSAFTENILPQYIRYIFNFGIAIVGLIAFGAIVYGGIRYTTSAGDPGKAKDGRDQISAGILGLVFLLSSYLVLTTINPQLVILTIPRTAPTDLKLTLPGVYLLPRDADAREPKNWKLFPGPESSFGDLNDKFVQIKIENPQVLNPEKGIFEQGDSGIGAVLHEDADFRGQCRLFLGNSATIIQGKDMWGKIDQPSSVSVFAKKTTGQGTVRLCTDTNGGGTCQDFHSSSPDFVGAALNDKVRSVMMDNNNFAVLFQHSPGDADNFPGICQVVTGNIPDLKNEPINKCMPSCPFGGWCFWMSSEPCTSGVVVFPKP